MARKYFDADDIVPQLKSHVTEQLLFSQNSVKVWVRASMKTMQITFMVEFIGPTGETTFNPAFSLEEAMKIAEDKQRT